MLAAETYDDAPSPYLAIKYSGFNSTMVITSYYEQQPAYSPRRLTAYTAKDHELAVAGGVRERGSLYLRV